MPLNIEPRSPRNHSAVPPSPDPYGSSVIETDETPIDDPVAQFTLELKREGILGLFYTRDQINHLPTLVEIDFAAYRNAAFLTLRDVIQRQILLAGDLHTTPAAAEIAHHLANGVAVMTHLKLRYINPSDPRFLLRLGRKPKVPDPFEVPIPYALAISKLGRIEVTGLTQLNYFTPIAPESANRTFGCPSDRPWNPIAYTDAVEYGKKLGLRFSGVDLGVKRGSSWWVYRPDGEDEGFCLQCPFPGENFTNESAVIAALFCCNGDGGFYNPIFDLRPLGDADYGTMLRNPHSGDSRFSVSVYDNLI